jgi:hypothetical protein
MEKHAKHNDKRGVVLLITLIVLVVLASLGYTLTTRIAAQVHRDQYIIDYQNARYACDSGLKYMLANLEGVTVKPIDRPNDPDFSDIFAFTDEEYKLFLAQWVADHPYTDIYEQYGQKAEANDVNITSDSNSANLSQLIDDSNLAGMDPNLADFLRQYADMNDVNAADWRRDPNKLVVPGPYGPPWPLVMPPAQLEIGNAKVTIEIEDENAKLPLVWGTNTDKDKQKEVDAAIRTFCEWMKMNAEQTDTLKNDLKDIGEIKAYKAGTPITPVVTGANTDAAGAAEANAVRQGLSRRGRRVRPPQAQPAAQQPATAQQQAANSGMTSGQIGDFIRLFHSAMIDSDTLAQPYIKTEQRTESVLKYMSRWGATQVNVNSAPRQVLEAAFMFGGDASGVSEAIITERQKQPFKDVNDLQKRIYKYADTIRKSKDFITTASNVFSVKITADSGVAEAAVTAAVIMEGKKPRVVAIVAE